VALTVLSLLDLVESARDRRISGDARRQAGVKVERIVGGHAARL
jgi:hypothetical protein